jgi:hypothetical protein
MGLVVGCASGTEGTAGNTELSLIIANPGGTSGELGFDIDRVDYRITCAGGAYLLPPHHDNPSAPNGDQCSTADLDFNGIPDSCPPGFNYIQGTAGPDNLLGTNGRDCIYGLGGNDIIDGRNDSDYICGGAGADTLTGDNGSDSLFGGDGNDTLSSGNGIDVLFGDAGDDALDGGGGDDLLSGGPGVDTLNGNNGVDTCSEEVPGSSSRLTGCELPYNDSVDISGAFEVVDTRVPPVWQAVMDLPPGDCTITLSVWEDDEVVCVGSQTLAILEDQTTLYDIVLVCSLSIDTPDGMADVDGDFFFITGNLCPKLYVLNAIPSEIDVNGRTEIQYRAKDPDNGCGNNCDPQSCTTANPPVCSPYPSNINDPVCNPFLGGNPNAPECLDGSHAGLVCTIAAFPLALPPGTPGGTFISPADGTTPVGPVLPVNLNTTSGIPGLILPGLGGPAGTNAENSPAYPGLPSVSGALPPLVYRCDWSLVGPVVIYLVCSDGDLECDQSKQITVQCPGVDYFCFDPNECVASGECLTDALFCNIACNPACDPSRPTYDADSCCGATNPSDSCGIDECERCPGQDEPLAPGASCTEGGGNVCDGAGTCVECLDGQNTQFGTPSNPNCDSSPVDCRLPSVCSGNACQPRAAALDGTPCSLGECQGGSCFYIVDPPPAYEKTITVGCTNSVSSDISILPFDLTVQPGVILSGQPVAVTYAGVAELPEVFLDAAQLWVPDGVTKVNLAEIKVTTQVRSGGTFPNVTLTNVPIPYECELADTGPGAQQACNPANDLASVPGSRGNSDCVPTGDLNPCGRLVPVPISSNCAPGGVCDTLGKLLQCSLNGFCVTGALPIPLQQQASIGTAGATGQILFGWYDDPAVCPFPGGSACALPPAVFSSGSCAVGGDLSCLNTGPLGLRVSASGLSVALECNQAADDGLGGAVKQPDSALIPFNIQVP